MKVNPFYTLLRVSVFSLWSAVAIADHGSIGFGVGTASPIITNTAITLPKGMAFFSLLNQYIPFYEISDSNLAAYHDQFGDTRDIHNVGTFIQPVLLAGYGITDDFTVAGYMPYVYRTGVKGFGEETDRVESLGSPNGIGDFRLFGEYRFFHTEDNLSNLTALFLVKAPTGITNRSAILSDSDREVLDTHQQPGSGSWDGGLGLSFTQAFGAFSFDSNVLYTWVTKGAQNTNLGDIFSYNFALSYALGGPSGVGILASSNLSKWTAVVELNGEWRAKQSTNGVKDPDSGSHILYLSPGIRWAGGPNWNLALSIGAPIVNNLNGIQVKPQYRLLGRFSIAF